MTSNSGPRRRAGPWRVTGRNWPVIALLSLSGCVDPVAVERPASDPSQAERSVCRELARDFPTWAYDEAPETVANRIDTTASVDMGVGFTAVFRAVCPGVLP